MRKAIVSSVLVLATTLGCVTAGEGEAMKADIAELKKQLEADRQAAANERQRIKDEAAAREQALKEQLHLTTKTGADLSVDLEKAQNDIIAVKGNQDVVTHRLDALEQGNLERDRKLDQLLAVADKKQKQQDLAEHPVEKAAIYALGLKKLEGGDPGRARELFTEFLTKFKGDELSGNAQYWLGETWYAEKKYNDAIVEFQKVLKEYKGSDKTPDALVKIGLSFQSQGDCAKAALFYDEVMASHRTTPAAKIAKEKSAECKKKK